MPRRRIDRFLSEALETFALWLKDHPEWRGKESECVNLFAHKFLFEKIEAGAAIECPTQVGIEVALKQPKRYKRPASNKDLVIWSKALQTTWSATWEPTHWPRPSLSGKSTGIGSPDGTSTSTMRSGSKPIHRSKSTALGMWFPST